MPGSGSSVYTLTTIRQHARGKQAWLVKTGPLVGAFKSGQYLAYATGRLILGLKKTVKEFELLNSVLPIKIQ